MFSRKQQPAFDRLRSMIDELRHAPHPVVQVPQAEAAPTNAFPVVTDGPGKYRVDGVDKESGFDTTVYVDGQSAANAKVKAELQGVIVTAVIRA